MRKAGEALRRSAFTEVDQLAAGAAALPAPEALGSWESLSAGEGVRGLCCWWGGQNLLFSGSCRLASTGRILL